ncbi:hypothetical protein Tco_0491550 [Tanacetum coccineum]
MLSGSNDGCLATHSIDSNVCKGGGLVDPGVNGGGVVSGGMIMGDVTWGISGACGGAFVGVDEGELRYSGLCDEDDGEKQAQSEFN